MRRPALPVLALAAAALAGGCAREAPEVARFEAYPTRLVLAFPEYTEIEIALEPKSELPAGAGAPIVFVHLVDEAGAVLRTFDHPFPGTWTTGLETAYRVRLHQSALAEPLDAGSYQLTMGLYDRDLGRYGLETANRAVARGEYEVGVVEVPAPDERTPHTRFSDNWLPAAPGADRQVLVRRTLRAGAPGTIQIGPLVGPGRLWLALEIPAAGADARLELAPGESQPKVRLASSCGGERAELAGPGRHELELDVPTAAAAWICDLEIAPNFQRLTGDNAEATAARLELLAWRATGADEP